MARIATVCTDERGGTRLVDMAAIRWYEISHALARLGHEVDIVHGRSKWRLRQPVRTLAPSLREVPLGRVRWSEYDVVKTEFHRGYRTLVRRGGGDHPFIISKLGSVVAGREAEGIYFYGAQRESLFRTQEEIARSSRYVTLLTEPARTLFREEHGREEGLLVVPGACRSEIPPRGNDPYPAGGRARAVFAGNFYSRHPLSQPRAHEEITGKLNGLGRRLADHGIVLYVIGPGDAGSLDERYVRYLGEIPYDRSWDYLRWADVGVVVSAGPVMHNNESTKIYHYLRVGLPVASESGFPNDDLVSGTGHGALVTPGALDELASAVHALADAGADGAKTESFILDRHTWTARAQVYDRIIRAEL